MVIFILQHSLLDKIRQAYTLLIMKGVQLKNFSWKQEYGITYNPCKTTSWQVVNCSPKDRTEKSLQELKNKKLFLQQRHNTCTTFQKISTTHWTLYWSKECKKCKTYRNYNVKTFEWDFVTPDWINLDCLGILNFVKIGNSSPQNTASPDTTCSSSHTIIC